MPYLALDTSTEHLSLAVTTPAGIVGRDWLVGQKHAELTLPRLAELLAETGLVLQDIEGIAFGNGPGSFTGLRIGCGIVQGLAFARGISTLGISTLEALAQSASANKVIACLDARMNQVYVAAYVREADGWREATAPTVCDPHALPLPEGEGWLGIGSGFAAYGAALAERLGTQLAGIEPELFPRAAEILALALPRFAAGQGVPAHEATLVYLRDKVALKTSERVKA
ncbi:tRNA threonylcarbamoyladenosine biosynthesis protein TsaB [Formivibrio citricus]|uniref:tRNA threonylcarbamoyladenosine biosynthesis protein TsaB n=1 Tax=Formivibrio citricus TaxID=83765 RepID=A0A1I4WJK2_9NEIS|nr:tRNA (adenosine(37)-N6)-threonylcarbamoyltransferase complex dimerization subunit type 1 TsaB [Formivibrio citricus]SFN14024.1 tRNA threonylcarbamoyladenosine biosynthesis protein TsaB [Formivibrio citricus]